MLTECASCGEPLTTDDAVCPRCRRRNPDAVRRQAAPLTKTLVVVGAIAFVLAVPGLLAPYTPPAARQVLARTLPAVMGFGFLALGAWGAIGNLLWASRKKRVLAEGYRSVGTVLGTDVREVRDHGDRVADVRQSVRFTTQSGEVVEFVAEPLRAYRWTRRYWPTVTSAGEKVEVAYDPERPARAFVVGRSDYPTVLAIAYAVGFAVGGVALLVQAFR